MDEPHASTTPENRSEATACLRRAVDGDEEAHAELFDIVYSDLRRLANAMLRWERPDHTLQPTALVHEAWLKLIDPRSLSASGKAHFLAIAAQAMRRILVDHARRRRVRREAVRRAGVPDAEGRNARRGATVDLAWIEQLDAALGKLELVDARKGRVVELHFFGGLTLDEVAKALGVSAPTVDRDWQFARAWLKTQLAAAHGS